MKIERISETQIRCTLSKQDLADRDLKISELAYGSEKAKDLFRELMTQASYECGFEAEDVPLMIEAIPVSGDCLVLIVTKVEDPDELDTRFSNFSSFRETSEDETLSSVASSVADEILECFGQLGELLSKGKKSLKTANSAKDTLTDKENFENISEYYRVYSFPTLNTVITLSKKISAHYFGKSILYKDEMKNYYYLVLYVSNHTPEEFNRICNVLSEYSNLVPTSEGLLSYFEEHFTPILKTDAIQTLASL